LGEYDGSFVDSDGDGVVDCLVETTRIEYTASTADATASPPEVTSNSGSNDVSEAKASFEVTTTPKANITAEATTTLEATPEPTPEAAPGPTPEYTGSYIIADP
jgi:hypothetical protein